MDYIQYLRRLHANKTENLSYLFLSKLQEQHLLTVPFENLDISHKKSSALWQQKTVGLACLTIF